MKDTVKVARFVVDAGAGVCVCNVAECNMDRVPFPKLWGRPPLKEDPPVAASKEE